jgi:hypothetical protein
MKRFTEWIRNNFIILVATSQEKGHLVEIVLDGMVFLQLSNIRDLFKLRRFQVVFSLYYFRAMKCIVYYKTNGFNLRNIQTIIYTHLYVCAYFWFFNKKSKLRVIY